MIVMTQVSGIPDTPPTGKAYVFAHTNGNIGIKTPDGYTGFSLPLSLASGLTDVVGTFAAGTTPKFDGNVFRPASVVVAPNVYTKGITGSIILETVLGSGQFANGTSGYVSWSGIDQTYDILEIHGEGQSIVNSDMIQCEIFFNGDHTATNYVSTRAQSNAASSQKQAQNNSTAGSLIGTATTRGVGHVRIPIHIIVPNYAVAGTRKYSYSLASSPNLYTGGTTGGTNMGVDTFCVQWEPTAGAAINMIEIGDNTGNASLTSGTLYTLVGKKAVSVNLSGTYDNVKIINGLVIP